MENSTDRVITPITPQILRNSEHAIELAFKDYLKHVYPHGGMCDDAERHIGMAFCGGIELALRTISLLELPAAAEATVKVLRLGARQAADNRCEAQRIVDETKRAAATKN